MSVVVHPVSYIIATQRPGAHRRVMSLVDQLASDPVLDRAYAWLCRQRRRWPDAADVWSFRRDWAAEKVRIQQELSTGSFRFGT